jgi:spore germination protein YaaH
MFYYSTFYGDLLHYNCLVIVWYLRRYLEVFMLKIKVIMFAFFLFFFNSTPVWAAPLKISGTPDKINLVWQPNFTRAQDDFSQLQPIEGVNIVSPCWFDIINVNGFIRNKANARYAKSLHQKGYKIWALITNSFNPEMTHIVLQNEAARSYVIEQLLAYAKQYQLDGYNLDFENIQDEDKDLLTAFVKEISAALKKENLIVSMDITVPSGESYWSNCYDRKALGETLDYIMLMAYDEHHPSSKDKGSTASISWVETGLKNTLQNIPSGKIVLGLPFYMRIWQQNTDTGKITSKTLSMPEAEKLIREKNIQPKWLDDQGQYYLQYDEGKIMYAVWQENNYSLQLKASLVGKYNLAGIACWRKGFETPDVWQVLDDTLKGLIRQ